jgi:hypothetical protein
MGRTVMRARARALVTVMVAAPIVLAMPAFAGSAAADPCSVLDPSCLLDTVEDVVDETTGTVEEVVDEVTGTVGDTVDEVTEGVGGGSGGGGGEPVPDDGGGGGGGSGPSNGPDDGPHGPRNHGQQPSLTGSEPLSPDAAGGSVAGVGAVPAPPFDPAPRSEADDAPTGVGAILARTALGVSVMLLLLALVAAFVSFQHTLDRRDPRLDPASLGSDRVFFA